MKISELFESDSNFDFYVDEVSQEHNEIWVHVWVHVISNFKKGSQYDDLSINVVFDKNSVEATTDDNDSEKCWQTYKKQIIDVALNGIVHDAAAYVYSERPMFEPSDKKDYIRFVLTAYKQLSPIYIIWLIKYARNKGYNYPEFKSIEKSMRAA